MKAEVPRRLVGQRVVLRGPVPSDADDRLAAGFDPEVVLLQGGEPSQFSGPLTRQWVEAWYERMVRQAAFVDGAWRDYVAMAVLEHDSRPV